MPNYETLTTKITEETGVPFRPGSPDDIASLARLGLPKSVLDFYCAYDPAVEINGRPRIYPARQIVEENRLYGPGCHTSRYGYVVFATTFCGDGYCYDINHLNAEGAPRIVLICHEIVDEQSTPEYLERIAKPVARELGEFLEQWIRDEVDQECIYG